MISSFLRERATSKGFSLSSNINPSIQSSGIHWKGKRIVAKGSSLSFPQQNRFIVINHKEKINRKTTNPEEDYGGLKRIHLKEKLGVITARNPLCSSSPSFLGNEPGQTPNGINYRSRLQIYKSQKAKKKEENAPERFPSVGGNGILLETGEDFIFELDNSKIKEKDIEPPVKVETPELKHGLERVLTSPGVHLLKPLHFAACQFDPFLENVHQPKDVDYDALQPYIPAGEDNILHKLAMDNDCKFKGSTSSVSTFMSHIYFLVSSFKPIVTDRLSSTLQLSSYEFSYHSKKPSAIVLTRKDEIYSIDSAKAAGSDSNSLLMDIGKSMECMLTMTQEEFEKKLLKVNNPQRNNDPQSYHYLKMGDCLFRSQLDCKYDGLPGPKKTFDLKTRSTGAIRYNISEIEYHTHQRLENILSRHDSYEMEYFDMIRSAFLKYNMQVRIGKMGGILVAYHNTAEIFGFEYVPQSEMDASLYGSTEAGDFYFNAINKILQTTLHTITKEHSTESIKIAYITMEKEMHLFVQPIPGAADRDESLCGIDGFFTHPVFYYKLTLDIVLDGDVVTPMNLSLKENVSIKLNLRRLTMNSELIFQRYQSIWLSPSFHMRG